jgi:putative DNA primase/helicase
MPPPSLAPIVRALGGDLWAGGARANVPGPGHGRADRSVALALVEGRVVAHSFAGDSWQVVLDDLRRRGLIDWDHRLLGAAGTSMGASAPSPSRAARMAAANALWAEGRPLPGTLGATHLRRRGLDAVASEALRHHPEVPSAVYVGLGRRRPALLAAIRDAAGDLVGVEVTYLAPNGERARLAVPRKTIGLRPPGSAVRLEDPSRRLLVGEGVATCLSAARRFGLPPWALLASGNLARWRAPPGVTFVLIAADRGRAGELAARDLARTLAAADVHGAIRWPPWPHRDWNEARPAGAGERHGGRGCGRP